jgi:signal transduction histidine kinase
MSLKIIKEKSGLNSEIKFKDFEYSDPEDVLTLLNDVLRYLNKTDDFNSALSYAINKICIYSSLDIGHCFVLTDNLLVSSKIWNNIADKKFDKLKLLAEKSIFKIGEGIPGICLENKKPFWILLNDIYFENSFRKIKLAKKLGLNTGIWVPIMGRENVIGVMEFFSVTGKPPGKQVMNAVVNIADELGNLAERNSAMDKLKSREKLLKETQRITHVGSWEINPLTKEVYFSDELYNIFDIKKNGSIPDVEEVKTLIHRDDINEIKNIYDRFLIKPFPFNIKFRIITGGGELKYLYAVTKTDFDDENNPARLYGSIQDITHIKQYEDEIYYANKKLLETQKELIQSEKLAVLGRFSAGIAHEIRNPLANISALSQLILKQIKDENFIKHLQMILDNTNIANRIIKDLLNYASPDEPVIKDENITEMLNEISGSIRARCEKNKINFSIKIEDGLPEIQIDKLRIKSALMNFLSNSIEAMPRGGNLFLNAGEIKDKELIKIEIKDTGIGISPDNLDKIFEPFFTTKHYGTGLGLGLAHSVIKSHNGDIFIKSKPKSGTTVEIILPVKNTKDAK